MFNTDSSIKQNSILILANDTISIKNFRIDMIRCFISYGYYVIVAAPGTKYISDIEKTGALFLNVNYKKASINIIHDLSILIVYIKIIIKYRPTKIFAYNLKPILYGMLACVITKHKDNYCLIPGAGYLFSLDGMAKILFNLVLPLYRFSLSKAKTVKFQNNEDKDEFIKLRLVKEVRTMVVQGSGINLEHFKIVDIPDKISFFHLGRLLTVKGIIDFCEAAKIIRRQYGDVQFHVAG
ncbi:hypothetical protein FACS1894184_05990 [Clostridia bacterium]|nr:hypothetical protein FACS1894184_05990 [Clostridia bacterium]